MIIVSGSLEEQTHQRLDILYKKHNDWLIAVAMNKTKDITLAKDLVQELYLYLGEKKNPKVFYRD